MKYDYFIGCDIGINGGLSVIDKFSDVVDIEIIPTKEIYCNGVKRNIYDVDAIVELLKPYQGKKVAFVQEKVSYTAGQSGLSAFSFGKSAGITEGLAKAFGFIFIEVSPIVWKKQFPQLNKRTKELKFNLKNEKTWGHKKEIEILKKQIQKQEMEGVRELASQLAPDHANLFLKVKDDRIAESFLIALYGLKIHQK